MNARGRFLCRVGATLLFVLPIVVYGGVSDADLQTEYGNKILTLRQFYPGEQLHFDATGKMANPVAPGPWTVDGQLRVQEIFLKDGVLHIRGQRLFLYLDAKSTHLRDAGSVTQEETASKYFRKKVGEWAAKEGRIEIEIECGNARPEMPDIIKVMNTIFLSPGEQLSDVVPDFWKSWVTAGDESKGGIVKPTAQREREIRRVGGGISAPHLTYSPDPPYSETARQAKYQGTTVLWLMVDTDGLPKHIQIARPTGMGLDEQAVDAVEKWKFDPAMKDGVAVPVQINVEVNFRLY